MEPHDETLSGQAQVCKLMFSSVDSMALNCVVELRIPNNFHSRGDGPVTLAQIASRIPSPSAQTSCLARIMRLLVRKNVFSAHHDGGETLYRSHPIVEMALAGGWPPQPRAAGTAGGPLVDGVPWHCLSDHIKDGGSIAFKRAYGHKLRVP
ncbi:hypothetical protein NL676_000835 [Syzygium grande]|nr:hypothetical protein NL676_000835 [Syzygium grande]